MSIDKRFLTLRGVKTAKYIVRVRKFAAYKAFRYTEWQVDIVRAANGKLKFSSSAYARRGDALRLAFDFGADLLDHCIEMQLTSKEMIANQTNAKREKLAEKIFNKYSAITISYLEDASCESPYGVAVRHNLDATE